MIDLNGLTLPEGVEAHKDLTALNTLRFPASARFFASPDSEAALDDLLHFAREAGLPVFPIGGGSNLILDTDPDALVICLSDERLRYQPDPDDEAFVRINVGAGKNWHDLVMETAGQGLYGLENLALIPGTVGAAPVQNIGAYGVELADRLVAVRGRLIENGQPFELSAAQCQFAYRDSIFKQQLAGKTIITELELRLCRDNRDIRLGYGDLSDRVNGTGQPVSALSIAQAVCAIRCSKLPDPAELPNAGSFFKNPIVPEEQALALRQQYPTMPVFPVSDDHKPSQVKLAAGWLIDQCGFKGCKAGPVGVYEKQALVLVHFGQGHADDLLKLADRIQTDVAARFGVSLDIEPGRISTLL